MKRIFLILSPLFFVLLVGMGLLKYFHPQIENFLLQQVRALSAQHLPVEISAEHVTIQFFPPALEVTGIEIASREPEKFGFSILDIDSAQAELDLLQLLVGRLAISTLKLTSFDIDLNLDSESNNKKSSANSSLNLDPVFDKLKIIPIHRLLLVDFSAKITSQKMNFNVILDESNALLVNEGDSIAVEADVDSSEAQFRKIRESAHLRFGLILNRSHIEIPQFHITTLKTDTIANATIFNLENIKNDFHIRMHLDTNVDLPGIYEMLKNEFHIPSLEGKLKIISDIEYEKGNLRTGEVDARGEDLKVDGFDIGKFDVLGAWKEDSFKAKKFQITNQASALDFPDFELEFKKPETNAADPAAKPHITLKTKLATDMLDLNQLLQNLKLGEIPVELIADGGLQCGGPLYPDFSVTCQGDIHSDLVEVRTANEKGLVVVQLSDVNINGTVNIDPERVQYHAGLKIGNDSGNSDGTIAFASGFQITYDTPNFDFTDIDKLANLKLEGHGKLSGKTTGNTQHAEFFIDADAQDVWFEDFFLGNPKTTIRYSLGTLSFENIVSNINASRFTADVKVDLPTKQLTLTGESGDADVTDVLFALQRKVKVPVELSGIGNVHIQASGPLEIGKMSYDLKTTIERGSIANEGYDSVNVEVVSQNGEVRSKTITLKKGQATVTGVGTAHPDGMVDLTLEGKNLLLEESENVARLGSNISGEWSFAMELKGFILHPEVYVDAELHNLFIEEQEFDSSTAKLKINGHGAQGSASLFGGKLKSDFTLPFSAQDPFQLDASARDWNYTTIFALIGGGPLLSEYQASLTGDMSFKADHGGFFASTGDATIMKAQLRRGNLELQNPGAMEIRMDKGSMALKNFRLASEDSYLELISSATTKDNLALKAKGNVPLHLFQIFLPFMDELSGVADVQANVTGSLERPEILGNARLDNGFVKLKSFPHAFEKLNAKVQFSQTKVLISEATGSLAGGSLTGEGTISILGLNNLPTSVRAHFENITLNVPDKIKTSGFGDIVFSGSWFPFTLSGTYHVTSGMITKEFENDNDQKIAKQSSYLPKILLQNAFEPILLNMQIIFDQPIAIKNSLIEGSLSGNILVAGFPSTPSLTGKINLERFSKISFRYNVFDVAAANITFNDPKEINPDLYISAQSHVNDYDISLTVQGTAKVPVIRLTSQPPLPEQDIVSLLALGITTSNQDDKGAFQQRDQQQSMMTQAGAALFGQISKEAQKAFDVDLQISSQYDDTKNIAVQKYTLSRKLTDKLTFSSVLTRGDEASTAFLLKYSLNPQLSVSTSVENVESVQTETSTETQPAGQILGLDLEYKQEFKW